MKRFLSISILFLALGLVIAGCEKMQTEGPATAEDVKSAEVEGEIPGLTTSGTVGTIVVGDKAFSVEFAVTDEEKARGLMNRESLPENAGMWFVFSQPVQERFWMKDTLIPLDILFVGDDMKVVYVFENAAPGSMELIPPTSTSVPDYKYVLEINGGTVGKKGIEVGDTVEQRVGP